MGLYYKPGTPVSNVQRDELNCTVEAERKVPVRNVTRIIPGRFIPGRRICDAAGNCRVTPPYWTEPVVITEDANLELRDRVAAQCMADRGYARISLPPCPPEVERAVPPAITMVMPKNLSPKACVIRRAGGQFQIVNRG